MDNILAFCAQMALNKSDGDSIVGAINAGGIGKICVFSTNVADYLGNGTRQVTRYYV